MKTTLDYNICQVTGGDGFVEAGNHITHEKDQNDHKEVWHIYSNLANLFYIFVEFILMLQKFRRRLVQTQDNANYKLIWIAALHYIKVIDKMQIFI